MKNTQYFDSSNTMQMYMEEIGKYHCFQQMMRFACLIR